MIHDKGCILHKKYVIEYIPTVQMQANHGCSDLLKSAWLPVSISGTGRARILRL